MGSGIAQVPAMTELSVIMNAIKVGFVFKGFNNIFKVYGKNVDKG